MGSCLPDYKHLYHLLHNGITVVTAILQEVQQNAEDIFCEEPAAPLAFPEKEIADGKLDETNKT